MLARDTRQVNLLRVARSAASFNTSELTCMIYGGDEEVRRRREAFERVEGTLGTRDTCKLPRYHTGHSREEAYDYGLECGKVAFEDGLKYKHDTFDNMTPRGFLNNSSPFGLSKMMFEPTLLFLGTTEQQERWLPLAKSGQIIGTYCQTELGHGTFVRGIETTATLDSETDEIILNSPTLSSTKFWPGALGFSCTHAIIVARLIVGIDDHGLHFFIVQVRSTEDGTPMQGIDLGDVGLKMAYNGTCNGYASFDNVRIPRENMLMGQAHLDRVGFYTVPTHPKLVYFTMLMTRGVIARVTGLQLAQAVTIATRYSVVREQGLGPNNLLQTETPILNYQTQHFRLLTIIAKAYAIHFSSAAFDRDYKDLRQQIKRHDYSALPHIHTLAAGIKAWSTQTAADGAEDARKCCGGQGYMVISGLPDIVNSIVAATTFEGENYVLWQQVGRYLFKYLDKLAAGKQTDHNISYLEEALESLNGGTQTCLPDSTLNATKDAQLLDPQVQLAIYRHRALQLVVSTWQAVRNSSKPPAAAWNEQMLSIINAARAHIEYTVLRSFTTAIENLPMGTSPPLKSVLTDLRSLFALSTIINPATINAISFIEDGYLSLKQLDAIRSTVNELLKKLVPGAVALTDAWDFTDASLSSCLGCWDGNVYERTMSWVRQIPMNVKANKQNRGVHEPGWSNTMKSFLKARL